MKTDAYMNSVPWFSVTFTLMEDNDFAHFQNWEMKGHIESWINMNYSWISKHICHYLVSRLKYVGGGDPLQHHYMLDLFDFRVK
jgi:hypothetical protein